RPPGRGRCGGRLLCAECPRLIRKASSPAPTLYGIAASGHYDVGIDPDLGRYHVRLVWYGLTSAWAWQREGIRVQTGVNANRYARDHYAFVRPDLVDPIYFNTGHKGDVSGFAKVSYDIGRATLFGDLQARRAEFRYVPDVHADISPRSIAWTF